MIPGTTSEKCLDTKVEIREDLPTPSVNSGKTQSEKSAHITAKKSPKVLIPSSNPSFFSQKKYLEDSQT
jgi:hypothetical protein